MAFYFFPRDGQGKRQSYEKPGFIANEGKNLVHGIGDCLDPRLGSIVRRFRVRVRERLGRCRAYLGSYTLSPRIMVVKRFASSIHVARNATLIVKLHTGS